jgi:hypothetical protein
VRRKTAAQQQPRQSGYRGKFESFKNHELTNSFQGLDQAQKWGF